MLVIFVNIVDCCFCLEIVLLQQRAHSAEPFSPDYGAESSNDSGVMIGATMLGISNLSARILCSSYCCGVEGALANLCSRMQISVCHEGTVNEGAALVILGDTQELYRCHGMCTHVLV